MQFDFEAMLAPERYKLLLATVLPRPIAWVTTRDARGAVNAAPFSFFNVFGNDPATVGIGIGSKGPAEVEEPSEAGLSLATSERVSVPRIAQAPVSMECTFIQEIALGSFGLVLGKIVMVHVRDEAVIDASRQYVDANKLDLNGRMEGAWYTTTRDRFEMPPIALSEWNEARSERRLAGGSK